MSFYGPKTKQRSFDELVLSESWFQFGDGRVLALRRMKLHDSPAVYAALEWAKDEAGDPSKITALAELARMFCFAPYPSLYIWLRRLFRMSDFSAATLSRRIIPMADRVKFEKWLIEENLDIDLKDYQESKLNEVKKNLLIGFAQEVQRIKSGSGSENWPPEISEKLRSFFLQGVSEDGAASPTASRRSKSGS